MLVLLIDLLVEYILGRYRFSLATLFDCVFYLQMENEEKTQNEEETSTRSHWSKGSGFIVMGVTKVTTKIVCLPCPRRDNPSGIVPRKTVYGRLNRRENKFSVKCGIFDVKKNIHFF
jgi:hypothetical protein